MVILGAIGSFTEKVEQRIDLMMEPMKASVSDFARLINFTKSDSEGNLVGYSWCNDHGVCLPLQVLSDYMPLLIEKVMGFGGALFVLITLVALFGYVAVKSFYIFLTYDLGCLKTPHKSLNPEIYALHVTFLHVSLSLKVVVKTSEHF